MAGSRGAAPLEAWAQSDVALAAQAPHVAAAYDAPAPPADALPSGFARARGRAPAGKRARRAAAGSEQLVALQLDVDAGGARLRDCVLWDARERHTSPEAFAALLVRDLNLPVYFTELVSKQMRAQLAAAGLGVADGRAKRRRASATAAAAAPVAVSSGSPSEVEWESAQRDTAAWLARTAEAAGEAPALSSAARAKPRAATREARRRNTHVDVGAGAGETLQLLAVDVRDGPIVVRDRIEWDVGAADPEAGVPSFVASMVADLGLTPQWAPRLEAALRDEIRRRRALLHAADVVPQSLPVVKADTAARPASAVAARHPLVAELSAAELALAERREAAQHWPAGSVTTSGKR